MKAVWYEKLGPADAVLQVGDKPTPEAGPGEVRVKLHASGVNPADVKRRTGSFGMEFPFVIPHSDGAGVVDQVGDGADPALLGKRVWLFNGQRNGRHMGTAAEYIALDAWLVAPLPGDLSFAEGACLGIPCMTAHYNVFADGPVAGKTVLVTGGAGAVGHYAVQWAKWGGATVIATVSSDDKAAYARAGGADHTVGYRSEDVGARVMEITGGAGADRIVEVDIEANFQSSLAALKPGGTIAVYAATPGAKPGFSFLPAAVKNARIAFMILYAVPRPALDKARSDIARWLTEAQRIHTVAATFPLADTAAAHRFVEAGGKLGTVVVDPSA
jgi:NADPH2:quinone reductase